MFNYYQVRQWHAEYDLKVPPTSLLPNNIGESTEIKFNRSYVKQKLDNGLTKLWMVCVISHDYLYHMIIT